MRTISEEPPVSNFKGWRKLIRRHIRHAIKAEKGGEAVLPPLDTEYGAIRYYCYRFLHRVTKNGIETDLISFVAEVNDKSYTGPEASLAMWVIRLVDLGEGSLKVPASRSRIAGELQFALDHNIRPMHVLGFFAEVGNQKTILQCAKDAVVPEAVSRYSIRKKRKS